MVHLNRFRFKNFPSEEDPDYDASDDSDLEESVQSEIMSFLKQIEALNEMFDLDRSACASKWNLFLAAALHYKREDLLRPIPPCFDNGKIDIKWLLQIINITPKFTSIHNSILEENYSDLNPSVISVLYSVLTTMAETPFYTMQYYKFQKIINLSELNMNRLIPTDVFDVCVEDSLEQQISFHERFKDCSRKFGFYGAPPAYFYSILLSGFKTNKTTSDSDKEDEDVEVEFIHLTTDLSVSLSHSDCGPCWGGSSATTVLKCVGICEYIDRPDCVQHKKDPNHEHTDVFISNGDMIRLRLVMFFKEPFPPVAFDEPIEYVNEVIYNNEPNKPEKKPIT